MPDLDAIRENALARADRARRIASAVMVSCAAVLAVLFFGLLRMIDWANELHVIVVLAACLSLGGLGLGLVALGGYVRSWILEAVRALEH